MNFETLMLRSLCALGMLVCALVLGAMLLATVTPAADSTAASAPRSTLASCGAAIAHAASPSTHG